MRSMTPSSSSAPGRPATGCPPSCAVADLGPGSGDGPARPVAQWLTVYRLPPYAYELNPSGTSLVTSEKSLANLATRNLAQLTALIKTRLRRIQYRPALLDGFLASTGLDLTPFCNPAIKDV
jgi:hypothetical protein